MPPQVPPTATDLEVLMLGQLAGQVHSLVSAPLRHHHNTTDLLHLRVVWRAHPIEVSCNLEMRSEIILSTNPECQKFLELYCWGWSDGSLVKNIGCRLGVVALLVVLPEDLPHGDLELSVTPVLGDQTPSFALYRYCMHMMYRQTKQLYAKNIFKVLLF